MKTMLLYLLLVGVPVVGLLGILVVGERLAPPRAVGGSWLLQPDPSADAVPCLPLTAPPSALTLTILQSGPRLDMRLTDPPETRLAGHIQADSLHGRARGGPPAAACPAETVLQLRARLQEQAAPPLLRGTFSAPGCPCSPVPFVATPAAAEDA